MTEIKGVGQLVENYDYKIKLGKQLTRWNYKATAKGVTSIGTNHFKPTLFMKKLRTLKKSSISSCLQCPENGPDGIEPHFFLNIKKKSPPKLDTWDVKERGNNIKILKM